MRETIGLSVFAAVLVAAAIIVTVQAKYDIARTVLHPIEAPIEDANVLTPVPAPAALTPVE